MGSLPEKQSGDTHDVYFFQEVVMQWLKRLRHRKTGLALGGGAVLGAAHVGVLKALEERGIAVDHVAGTSIGSLIGALYAFGKTPAEIEQISKELRWLDISELSLSKLGLMSNKRMADMIIEHIGDRNIEQADIPLSIVTADITTGERVTLTSGSVAEAVRASTCIPGIFIPVEWEDRLLVDGGVVQNVPLSPLKEAGANYIIGVELLAHDSANKPENIVEVLLNTFEFMISNVTRSTAREFQVLISPDLSRFDKVSTSQVEELIKVG